ncbi:MAG: outer membrane beta-barrel protein [Gemmatimonadota bacterium]|nr:outer membrane beta-barrel protein [Gemmatimonadota bacterium]
MRYVTGIVLAALVGLVGATDALAQVDAWEFNVHAGAFQRDLGFDEGDDTDTDVLAGARLMRHWDNGLGVGGNFDWVFADEFDLPPGFDDEDVNINIFLYSAEIQYTFPTTGPVDFFVGGGIGAMTTQFDDLPGADDFLDETETDLLIPLAAGLRFLNDEANPTWGFRVDGRDNIQLIEDVADPVEGDTDTEVENNWELSAGLSFFFGGGEPVEPAPVDTDGDGVVDDRDRCPGTAPGTEVDSFGCPVPIDSDGDGVLDENDDCPGTEPGTEVDADGCPIVEEPEPAACIDGRDWFRNDEPIFVEGREWVKFGAPRTIAASELVEVTEFDGVPVYARSNAQRPYREILLPFCAPADTYQAYQPEQEIRGTTG